MRVLPGAGPRPASAWPSGVLPFQRPPPVPPRAAPRTSAVTRPSGAARVRSPAPPSAIRVDVGPAEPAAGPAAPSSWAIARLMGPQPARPVALRTLAGAGGSHGPGRYLGLPGASLAWQSPPWSAPRGPCAGGCRAGLGGRAYSLGPGWVCRVRVPECSCGPAGSSVCDVSSRMCDLWVCRGCGRVASPGPVSGTWGEGAEPPGRRAGPPRSLWDGLASAHPPGGAGAPAPSAFGRLRWKVERSRLSG